jgi:predicted nucleotide-binding protein
MTFQWKLLKPARPISRLQRKTAVLIAEHYLKTGQGFPINDLQWQLRAKRNVLGQLDQLGLIQNDAGKYYPTFPALYFLPVEIRNGYTGYLHYVMKAIQMLYERGGDGRYPVEDVLKQMPEALDEDNGVKLESNDGSFDFNRAILFLSAFRSSVTTEPNFGVVVKSIIPVHTMIDYKNLTGAWKLELKMPQNIPTYLRPTNPAPAAAIAKVSDSLKPEKDKAKKVFVVYGRDERLRKGMFAFLRSLNLEPLEWNTVTGSTGKAAPYIGEGLDAAFSQVQAVVVLLSPDDEVRLRSDLLRSGDPATEKAVMGQARPNVLFESGMALASHPDQTVLVEIGHVKPFSDVAGRHTVRMDNSFAMRQELALKLKTAGCPVNMEGIDWHTAGDLNPPSENTVARFEKQEQSVATKSVIGRTNSKKKRKKKNHRAVFGQTKTFQIGSRVHILQPEPGKPREQWLYSSEVWAIRKIDESKGTAMAMPLAERIGGPTPTVEGPMTGPQSPFIKVAIQY